jgi:predicted metal-dependent hydrolase
MTVRVLKPSTAETEPLVEVRRSARRRRTVSAYRDGDRTVVLIPARMSQSEERRWVKAMLERLARQDRKLRPGDDALFDRAVALSRRHLVGAPMPASVRWVGNQGSRWGSCTPSDRTIRLSHRLQGMPGWVLDYVIVHELVHLRVPGHGADFWAEVAQYPRTERARGYLEGVSAAAGLGLSDTDEGDEGDSRHDDSGHVDTGGVEADDIEPSDIEPSDIEPSDIEIEVDDIEYDEIGEVVAQVEGVVPDVEVRTREPATLEQGALEFDIADGA